MLMLAMGNTLFSLAQEPQSTQQLYSSDELEITVRFQDCHYPEKGVHNRYALLHLKNPSTETLHIEYTMERAYNGRPVDPDVAWYEFDLPENGTLQADCDNLTDGLHIFVKRLNGEAASILSDLQIGQLKINGKTIDL